VLTVVVSIKLRYVLKPAVFDSEFLLKKATVIESTAEVIKDETVIDAPVAVPVSEFTLVVEVPAKGVAPLVTEIVTPETAAFAGTEERTPRPNAATATSAMRLKFVVVDIYFLSLVATRNFLVAASR
jgi:hypothetical protein